MSREGIKKQRQTEEKEREKGCLNSPNWQNFRWRKKLIQPPKCKNIYIAPN